MVPKTLIPISVDRYEQPLSAEVTDRYYQTVTTEANNSAWGLVSICCTPKTALPVTRYSVVRGATRRTETLYSLYSSRLRRKFVLDKLWKKYRGPVKHYKSVSLNVLLSTGRHLLVLIVTTLKIHFCNDVNPQNTTQNSINSQAQFTKALQCNVPKLQYITYWS